MDQQEQEKLEAIIHEKIEETEEEIEQLKELTKPIAPANAIGRLSRMDAINNKTINDAALRKQKKRLKKLERDLINLKKVSTATAENAEILSPLAALSLCPGPQNV